MARPDHTHQKKGPGVVLPYLHQLLHSRPASGKLSSSILAVGAILFCIWMLFRNLAPTQTDRPGYHPHHRPNTASPTANAPCFPVGYFGQPPQSAPRNMSQGCLQRSETPEISPHTIKYDELQEGGPPLTSPANGGVQDRPAIPPPLTECQETAPPNHRHLRKDTWPPPRAHLHQPLHTHVSRDPGQPPPQNRKYSA